MTLMPEIRGPDRNKPIYYDPTTDRFITLDDLEAEKGEIVPVDELTQEQQKRLVIERNRVGSDYTQQAISGPAQTRDEVIREIEAETESGRMAVQADIMYLRDLQKKIKKDVSYHRRSSQDSNPSNE